MNDKTIKVLIVDDHAILRMGLASLLNTKKDIKVVGDASNGAMAVSKTLKLNPDVVIVDLMMPGMDGVETTKNILAAAPNTKVMILTTFGTSDGIIHALAAGARGAIMKSVEFPELVAAIRSIASGDKVISPEIQRILESNPPVPTLSPRQTEILESIVRGLSNIDIAKQLGISLDMVKEHVSVLFLKIGAATRAEAVAIALRKHLLKP
ncbi:MAG: response regulator transcription factor [Kiritimatiellae bacterium]|nr:response regulator transcription factor [Kiritimatiellia bacterium]